MKTVVDTLLSSFPGEFMNGREYPWAYFPPRTTFRKVWVFTSKLIYCARSYRRLLIMGSDDELNNFITNVGTVFQRCREKNVTLNSKTLMIGKDKVPFVRHEINSSGINMSQKQIEEEIAFTTPQTLKEQQSFLGLINYFKDHIRDHAHMSVPYINSEQI